MHRLVSFFWSHGLQSKLHSVALRADHTRSLERCCQPNRCFPLVQRICWMFLSCCFTMHFSRAHMEVKHFQLFCSKCAVEPLISVNLWPKQPIKSSRMRAFLLTTSFLLCCHRNSGRNNRIKVNIDEKIILAVFSYRCASNFAFRAALPGTTCLDVNVPLAHLDKSCWAPLSSR